MGVLRPGACPGRARARAALLLAALLAPAALAGLACGGATLVALSLPGAGAERLDPIYDATVTYPDTTLIIGGLPYRGLEIELEIEFTDATLRDDDPVYLARARVETLRAGGVAQGFEIEGPLDIEGTVSDGTLATGFFGPLRVGNAVLLLDLTGELRDGARRVAGSASLFGTADPGWFVAVKRRRYLVAGTDRLAIGKVSVVSVRYDTRFAVEDDLEVTSSDPMTRVEDGRPFVINRLSFDNLQGLDPFAAFATSFQHSTGNGSNPHDAVLLPPGEAGSDPAGPGLAFVTRYEPPFNDVAVMDLEDGAIVDRIDLTPYARNADHLPRADQALLHDGLIYVTLEDANRSFTEFMNGRVVVIDPVARQVVDVIDLAGQNPFEALTFLPETGLIYVGLAGIFRGLNPQALTGGIEAIDPAARRSLGLVVNDDDLGGNVAAVAVHSATRGYCVVTDANFRNFVKAFDPTTGEVLGTVFDSANQIADIAVDGDGYLLIGENDFLEPRIIVLDAATGSFVTSLPVRLPPFSFAILTRSL